MSEPYSRKAAAAVASLCSASAVSDSHSVSCCLWRLARARLSRPLSASMDRFLARHPKAVFHTSLAALLLSGVGVIAIDSVLQTRRKKYYSALTEGLWKFAPEEENSRRTAGKVWQFRKLLLLGVMMSSFITAFATKFMTKQLTAYVGLIVFAAWTIFVNAYWYYYRESIIGGDMRKGRSTFNSAKKKIEAAGWDRRTRDVAASDGGCDRRDQRLPVTIVTGYLGSGKTTLVKNILRNTVGMKVLVIENEIGAEGIDHELIMQSTGQDDIILMNNGCVCCTVRKDLLTTFHQLFNKDMLAALDWVVIETTGVANPAPIIQSFFMDSKCVKHLRLDGTVAVVDAKHFEYHYSGYEKKLSGLHGDIPEAIQQVIYADRVLLNKVDLVTAERADALEAQLHQLNRSAQVLRCKYSDVSIDKVLNIRSFDAFAMNAEALAAEQSADIDIPFQLLECGPSGKVVRQQRSKAASKASGLASGAVSTVSLMLEGALSLDKFNLWISTLMREKGGDLYRLKGILNMFGYESQFLAQGVHMIFDGYIGSAWVDGGAGSIRRSRLVFIGKRLDEQALRKGFAECLHGT